MHQKRATTNKGWAIPRKGTKYVVVPSHNKKTGIPILIIMRDILKMVKTRKELEKILYEKKIAVNGKIIKEDNYSLSLFDIMSIDELKKNYKILISKSGKTIVEEINNNEALSKIAKIANKKVLKGNKIQLNLNDGRSILSNEKAKTGDSVVINFKSGKIEKILPIKVGMHAIVIKGKHIGKSGKIINTTENNAVIHCEYGDINIKNKELIVTA
ncbi:MAG: hypothetical protein WC533_00075 [Candidatus Pacearchaeota archaeon]